ncbi:MAG: hypothetical protein ACXV99_15095, partial [Candidatus Angelobacter sp.]
VNPGSLRQGRTQNGSRILVKSDPACHGQTIRENELKRAAFVLMQAARAAFDVLCLTVKTRFI